MIKDIEKLKEEQLRLRDMVDKHKATGIPSVDELKLHLDQNAWNLQKIIHKLKKLKKEIMDDSV